MSIAMKYLFVFSLLTAGVLSDMTSDHEEPQQDGKSFFFLGGLIRRIKSRWQNQNQPPLPYGGGPIYTGYYGCTFYNCRPPHPYQMVPPVQAIQPIQPIQPLPTVVQTPLVAQQAQVYQPNAYAQAIAQPGPGPSPAYPIQPQPQNQQFQYAPQVGYGSPQPAYGNPQSYPPYPVYPPGGYASPIPGQVYQNSECAYPGYICGRKT